MARCKPHHAVVTGSFAGYTEWRYGKPQSRPAKRAGQKRLRGQKREHVINAAMDVMRDWRLSPFEHEGAMRAGLRSGLCLEGYGWEEADISAADVVSAVLGRMRAVRPTWTQGQREYVDARETCVRCGTILSEEQVARREGFCSEWCAASTKAQNRELHRRVANRVGIVGWRIAAKAAAKPRPCRSCGKPFKALKASTAYCSHECACRDARTIYERACAQCGKVFRPRNNSGPGRFCSRECMRTFREITGFERTCVWCGQAFRSKSMRAQSCSADCNSMIRRYSNPAAGPRPISPVVLDFLFRRQGLRVSQYREAA